MLKNNEIDMIFESAKDVFNKEVLLQRSQIIKENSYEEAAKRLDFIQSKVIHTREVLKDGEKVMINLGIKNENLLFGKIALMDHDIGRFLQMRSTGTYNDSVLKDTCMINDHGELGCMVLDRIIDEQLPKKQIYHQAIKEIVRKHVNATNPIQHLSIIGDGTLKENDIDLLLVRRDTYNKVISCFNQIVQDVDRLDIYHQILDGRWVPLKEDLSVPSEVLKMFYNGEYLDINKLKKQGLWNANVGELVRLSFIDKIRLFGVAKLIKEENLILKMRNIRKNQYVDEAFLFANDKLDEMINNSPDGIVIGPVKTLKPLL